MFQQHQWSTQSESAGRSDLSINMTSEDSNRFTLLKSQSAVNSDNETEDQFGNRKSMNASTVGSTEKHDESSERHEEDGTITVSNFQPRICLVCGDRASGYNFNVLSCESCKAFFRRNALKKSIPVCLFAGICKIETHTRRFCTACRLDKCLKVGMKRGMILDDDAKGKRREKVLENRKRRARKSDSSPTPSTQQDDCEKLQESNPPIPSQVANAVVAPCIIVEPKMEDDVVAMAVTSVNPAYNTVYVAVPTFTIKTQPPDASSLLTRVNRRVLTDEEWRFISSLRCYYEEAFIATGKSDEVPHPNTTLNALLNVAASIVRKLIRFAKRVIDFQSLNQSSQIALLKGVVFDTFYLCSAFHYDVENDSWSTPHGLVRVDILKRALSQDALPAASHLTLSRSLYEEHGRFVRSLRPLLDDDLHILALLQLIALFSPGRPAIVQSQNFPHTAFASAAAVDSLLTSTNEQVHIANIQDKFVILLKHYLEAKYSVTRSRTLLVSIMHKLDELNDLAEVHGRVLLFADPSQIEPLMLEVFDLMRMR